MGTFYGMEYRCGRIFLRNRLKAEINYFNELRDNIIGVQSNTYADVLGNFISYRNIGKVRNNGIDAYVQWSDRNGDFSYQVGANVTWSKNKLLKWNEVNYPDSYLRSVDKPTDAMIGYQALGLFGKDVSLGRNISQLLGNYQEGDIAYADLNNDGVVDARDKKCWGIRIRELYSVLMLIYNIRTGDYIFWVLPNWAWMYGKQCLLSE